MGDIDCYYIRYMIEEIENAVAVRRLVCVLWFWAPGNWDAR